MTTATQTATAAAGDAARLVGYALRPKLSQAADEDYARLWRMYRGDDGFRDIVDAIVEGLGLVVLGLTNQGLIVAPSEDSPFAFRLSDYGQTVSSVRGRTLTGLIHLGIAASCFPREADLEEEAVVRRSVGQVEELLRALCRTLSADGAHDPLAEERSELGEAWRAFDETPSSRTGKKGNYLADCTLGMITTAFEWLVEQGFARRTSTTGAYQVLDRYRIQVRELAGHRALAVLREHAVVSHTEPPAITMHAPETETRETKMSETETRETETSEVDS